MVALLLFLSTFAVSSPTVPRVLSILVVVVGVATAAGFVPVRGPQDFYGGLVLVAAGDLGAGRVRRLAGPARLCVRPRHGAAAVRRSCSPCLARRWRWSASSPMGRAIEKYKIRGPALVLVGIFLFAALIRPFGLVVATYLAFIVSIMGSTGDALGRKPHRGGGDDAVLRPAVRLPAQSAVPALAAAECAVILWSTSSRISSSQTWIILRKLIPFADDHGLFVVRIPKFRVEVVMSELLANLALGFAVAPNP